MEVEIGPSRVLLLLASTREFRIMNQWVYDRGPTKKKIGRGPGRHLVNMLDSKRQKSHSGRDFRSRSHLLRSSAQFRFFSFCPSPWHLGLSCFNPFSLASSSPPYTSRSYPLFSFNGNPHRNSRDPLGKISILGMVAVYDLQVSTKLRPHWLR